MRRHSVGAVGALALAFLAGCGSSEPPIVPAEGVVLLNGAPLSKAKVRFFPKIDKQSKYFAQGVTDDSGHFTLTCRGKPGACAVENIVTVDEDEIPEKLIGESARDRLQEYLKSLPNRPIPPLYRIAGKSPLRITVTADQKEYRIELQR